MANVVRLDLWAASHIEIFRSSKGDTYSLINPSTGLHILTASHVVQLP